MSPTKALAAAVFLLWLLGLMAAIVARQHRQKVAAQQPNQPLLAYVIVTIAALAVGLLYWRTASAGDSSETGL